ncbi:MAG: aminopeptidase N C-terminal domain-containing protein, partial [Pseudomonadota bacterium]
VADVIRDADKRNPALAARLLTAFESWKALIPETRAKAETVLKGLKGEDLSKNAADIISRTLG